MNTNIAVSEDRRAVVRRHHQPAIASAKPFLADALTLRQRVRQHLQASRPATSCLTDRETLLKLLGDLLAMELLCVLRCGRYRFMTSGIEARSIANDFGARSSEEQEHANQLAERIFVLGGEPNFSPAGLVSRGQSAQLAGKSLIDLIKEDLLSECIAMDSYRDIIQFLGTGEPATRQMLEEILAAEGKHASTLADLLETWPA